MTDYEITIENEHELDKAVYNEPLDDVTDRDYVELSRDIAGSRDEVFDYFSDRLDEGEVVLTPENVFEAVLEQTREKQEEYEMEVYCETQSDFVDDYLKPDLTPEQLHRENLQNLI